MTKDHFLIDTVQYYGYAPAKRRCVKWDKHCVYSPVTARKSESDGCGIGRHLPEELRRKLDVDGGVEGWSIGHIFNDFPDIFAQFPQWMRELPIGLLVDVQQLHDAEKNWAEVGLSENGRVEVKLIAQKHGIVDLGLLEPTI